MLTIFILLLLVSLLIFTTINTSFSVESIEAHPHTEKYIICIHSTHSTFQHHQRKHLQPFRKLKLHTVGRLQPRHNDEITFDSPKQYVFFPL